MVIKASTRQVHIKPESQPGRSLVTDRDLTTVVVTDHDLIGVMVMDRDLIGVVVTDCDLTEVVVTYRDLRAWIIFNCSSSHIIKV